MLIPLLLLIICFNIFNTDSTDLSQSNVEQLTVYIFLSDECTICKYYLPEINRLYDTYSSEGVSFVGVFPNFSSKKENIEKLKEKFDIVYELKTDYYKKLSLKYNVKMVPEIVVVNKSGEKLYQGRIDNSYYRIGKRRKVTTEFELRTILENLDNPNFEIDDTNAVGCFINYGEMN